MDLVLDCSVTMAWLFEDENDQYAEAIREQLRSRVAIVPVIWRSEVATVILVGQRRKRLTGARGRRFLHLLEELPITVDDQDSWRTIVAAFRLAQEHKLTVYDATYLELALRYRLPLATLDRALHRAAARVGLPAA